MFVIVLGAYPSRDSIKACIGPFPTMEVAKLYQANHNFGPNGSKVVPLYNQENYDASMPR